MEEALYTALYMFCEKLEKEWGRTLSTTEIEYVAMWIGMDDLTFDEFQEALKACKDSRNIHTLKQKVLDITKRRRTV